MSYRYDSYLVIANKFGSASSDAKAQLFETYDQLRDITVSGTSGSQTGSGLEGVGGFLYNMATLFSPAAFAPSLSGNTTYNIPGTSYYSQNSGRTSSASYGLESYSGFAAPIEGYGTPTGFASGIGGIADIANAASYATGTASGYGGFGKNMVISSAGFIAGMGGLISSMAPYMGEYGLGAILAGNFMEGSGSAALAALQNTEAKITSNADTILTNKVKNIETVCKMLDTQGDVVKKMLKESIDGDSKAIQNL
jgi:hypothetical protein